MLSKQFLTLCLLLMVVAGVQTVQAATSTSPYNYDFTGARGNSCSVGVKFDVNRPVLLNEVRGAANDTGYSIKVVLDGVTTTYSRANPNSTALIVPALSLNPGNNISIYMMYNSSSAANRTWARYPYLNITGNVTFNDATFTALKQLSMDSVCPYNEGNFTTSYLASIFTLVYSDFNTSSLNITAQEQGINTTVSAFTATLVNSFNTTTVYVSGTSSTVNLTANNYTATINRTGYFTTNQAFEIPNTNNNYSLVFNATRYFLQIKARNTITNTNDTTFTVLVNSTTINYSVSASTTNGTVVVPWFNDTNINLTITAASSVAIGSSTLWNTSNYTTTPMLVNISVSGLTGNSTSFTFYDEITSALMNGTNISIQLSGASGLNTTTTNGTLITSLTPGTYVITYSATGYNQRQYTFTLSSGASSSIVLFLRLTSASTPILLQVRDESQQKVIGAVVYMNIRNLSGTNDYLAEMCVTDVNGQCVVSADVSTTTYVSNTTYSFVVIYNNVTVGTSGYLKISTTANAACNSALPCVQIQATLGSNALRTFFLLPQVQYTPVNYTTSTNVFSFSVVDINGIVQQICLQTTVRAGATYAVTNTSCTSGVTASISVFSNTTLGDETTAVGYIYVNGQIVVISSKTISATDSGGVTNVLFFLFMGLLVLGTIFMSYRANASLALIMTGGVAVILFYVNAFPLITNAFIVSLILLLIIVVTRSKE